MAWSKLTLFLRISAGNKKAQLKATSFRGLLFSGKMFVKNTLKYDPGMYIYLPFPPKEKAEKLGKIQNMDDFSGRLVTVALDRTRIY